MRLTTVYYVVYSKDPNALVEWKMLCLSGSYFAHRRSLAFPTKTFAIVVCRIVEEKLPSYCGS